MDGTLELFRRHWPGTRHATLRSVASSLGVRETRRIRALGYLSVQDVLHGREFDDAIGYTAYGWDINRGAGEQVHPKALPKPPVIPIPYRVMVPERVGNLICPGRAVNCERPGARADAGAGADHGDGPGRRHRGRRGNRKRPGVPRLDVERLRTSLADDGAIGSL